MNITFKELRKIKHQLPKGSVKQLARKLKVKEQTIRNYFGANKTKDGAITDKHKQPGPEGGIVNLKDTTILELALKMIRESKKYRI